ncbi:MAG: response regulator [Acidobacteria bacterium]|nr:response regulator [Acidobacteriota bacterium]
MACRSVLIVEDQKLLNWSLVRALSKWGYQVSPVASGQDAVFELERSAFDVVLLDYRLPDVDGLQIARRARKLHPESVIVLLTAFQLSELAVDPGLIDAYFNKPLDLEELHRTLESIPASALRPQRTVR